MWIICYLCHCSFADSQADLLEHVALINQAQYSEKLEQMRQSQAQQRGLLIQQQKEQMSRLETEQKTAESRAVAQRQNQWGSKTSGSSTSSTDLYTHCLLKLILLM